MLVVLHKAEHIALGIDAMRAPTNALNGVFWPNTISFVFLNELYHLIKVVHADRADIGGETAGCRLIGAFSQRAHNARLVGRAGDKPPFARVFAFFMLPAENIMIKIPCAAEIVGMNFKMNNMTYFPS